MKTYTFLLDQETKNYYKFKDPDNDEVNFGKALYLKKEFFPVKPDAVEITIKGVVRQDQESV